MIKTVVIAVVIILIVSMGCLQGKKVQEQQIIQQPVEIKSYDLSDGKDTPTVTTTAPTIATVTNSNIDDDIVVKNVPPYQEPEPEQPNYYWYQPYYPLPIPPVIPVVVTIYTGSIGITIED